MGKVGRATKSGRVQWNLVRFNETAKYLSAFRMVPADTNVQLDIVGAEFDAEANIIIVDSEAPQTLLTVAGKSVTQYDLLQLQSS